MLLARINKNRFIKIPTVQQCYSTIFYNEADEYTATPNYPPILDISPEKRRERERQAKYDEIKLVKTVEEKQLKLNMPKYYGFKCYMFDEHSIPYDNLTLAQHITRTHLIENDKYPEYFDSIKTDELSKSLESTVQDVILLEHEGIKRTSEFNNNTQTEEEIQNIIGSAISKQINRAILNSASTKFSHLKDVEYDLEPRIESSWVAGGMNPPENIKRYRAGTTFQKDRENEPTDRVIQYIGQPILALRSQLPLPVVTSAGLDCKTSDELEVPYFQYDPRTVGTKTEHRHIANIPGFWPGHPHSFPLLSYHSRGALTCYSPTPRDQLEATHRQGILSSFAYLNSLANHMGFTTYNDITWPLVTQTVVTDGRRWSCYVYQMNTLALHGGKENAEWERKRNVCWASGEMELYQGVSEGKVVGFNGDVLERLVRLYGNVPRERLGVNYQPYLGDEKVCADYKDAEKRTWLEREYKHLMSNRPRHVLGYEIYHWEKIYKIDHQTRLMEPKRRPFELAKKPFNRPLNERMGQYIPKKHRPDLPRKVGRIAKEFWP